MKDTFLTISKASAVGDLQAPYTVINITEPMPDFNARQNDNWLADNIAFFEQQAKDIEEALILALPGGTYDRLFARMAMRKASVFHVAHKTEGE